MLKAWSRIRAGLQDVVPAFADATRGTGTFNFPSTACLPIAFGWAAAR